MNWNFFLAVVGMVFGVVMYRVQSKFLKIVMFILWILFIPNSIYVLTDLTHLVDQIFEINTLLLPILVIQYFLFVTLGVITFKIGVTAFEEMLLSYRFGAVKTSLAIITVNFAISYAVMVGRFQRTNSWEVFIDPFKVLNDILSTFFTLEHLLFTILFGFFCNILYFGLKKQPHFQKYEHNIIGRVRSRSKR